MSQVYSYDVVFFFGAGVSAPFGIPTMKEFVLLFENELGALADQDIIYRGDRTGEEKDLYTNIKKTLEEKLHRPVDLETVFTIIDGMLNYSTEKLGLLSLYSATEFRKNFPNELDVKICKLLKERFQEFVREKCIIPEESYTKIRKVYHDFFNRLALELPGANTVTGFHEYLWNKRWAIFTTNYDTCLEYYWRDVVRGGIDTGFEFDRSRGVNRMEPFKYLREDLGIQLFKLHGSINWLIEKESGEVVEQEMMKGHSLMGRRYEGEMMVYPIAEKQLYLNPYISMLLRLNRELDGKSVWIVIGYSFNDPIVKEIFVKRSDADKHLILVHPEAEKVCSAKLGEFKGRKTLIPARFGLEEDFRVVNYKIIKSLKDNPQYDVDNTPTR